MAVSFIAAVLYSWSTDDIAYYSTPTRAWELMAGGTLALVARRWPAPSPGATELAGLAGLAMIVAPIPLLDSSLQPRALWLTIPVFGTVLFLLAGRAGSGAAACRLLAVGPLVGIGLISYSWYLWHWPLTVFVRLTQIEPLSVGQQIAATIVVPFLLGVATYYGVERPLRGWRRRPDIRLPARRLVVAGVACSAILALVGGGLSAWSTYLSGTEQFQAFSEALQPIWRNCEGSVTNQLDRCRIGPAARARVLVWGDSHAVSLQPAVEQAAVASGSAAHIWWVGGCPGLVSERIVRATTWTLCIQHNQSVMEWLRSEDAGELTAVVLSSRWEGYGDSWSLEEPSGAHGSLEMFARAVRDTIAEIDALGLRVLVVGPVVSLPQSAPECVFLAQRGKLEPSRCWVPRAEADARLTDRVAILRTIVGAFPNARFIEPAPAICDETWCRAERAGQILYADAHHLAPAGSRLLYAHYRDAFAWTFE